MKKQDYENKALTYTDKKNLKDAIVNLTEALQELSVKIKRHGREISKK